MTQTTIYLDVDGVENAVAGGRNPEPGTGGWDEWRTIDSVEGFPISYAPEMLRRIEAWAERGADIAWLTTWGDLAPSSLCPAIGLKGWSWRVVEETVRRHTEVMWWKLRALQNDYDRDVSSRFVWIDDDLKYEADSLEWQKLFADRSLLVSPDTYVGLTREQVEQVDRFLDG